MKTLYIALAAILIASCNKNSQTGHPVLGRTISSNEYIFHKGAVITVKDGKATIDLAYVDITCGNPMITKNVEVSDTSIVLDFQTGQTYGY